MSLLSSLLEHSVGLYATARLSTSRKSYVSYNFNCRKLTWKICKVKSNHAMLR